MMVLARERFLVCPNGFTSARRLAEDMACFGKPPGSGQFFAPSWEFLFLDTLWGRGEGGEGWGGGVNFCIGD